MNFFLLYNYNNKNIPIPCKIGKNDGRVISIEWKKLTLLCTIILCQFVYEVQIKHHSDLNITIEVQFIEASIYTCLKNHDI